MIERQLKMLNMSNYTEGDESDDEERDIYLSIRESAVNNQSET